MFPGRPPPEAGRPKGTGFYGLPVSSRHVTSTELDDKLSSPKSFIGDPEECMDSRLPTTPVNV